MRKSHIFSLIIIFGYLFYFNSSTYANSDLVTVETRENCLGLFRPYSIFAPKTYSKILQLDQGELIHLEAVAQYGFYNYTIFKEAHRKGKYRQVIDSGVVAEDTPIRKKIGCFGPGRYYVLIHFDQLTYTHQIDDLNAQTYPPGPGKVTLRKTKIK